MFRTELNVAPSPWKISIDDIIFSMGSCFAIHIGEQLTDNKFDALTNPFGTIFNPLSLFKLIDISLNGEEIPDWAFLENQGVYRNYLFHSDISSLDKIGLLNLMDEKINATSSYLQKANVILLTFGTAIYYQLKETGEIVANCHKVPSEKFIKRIFTSEDIIKGFENCYQLIRRFNPGAHFIITVSPVRHMKDSFELNSVSKATLRMACEEIRNHFKDVSYFPSFEIMMDDLRDYRFYNEDMLHPNDMAVKYIWGKFKKTYLDDETVSFINEWTKIKRAIDHRPFYPGSKEYKIFLLKTIEKIVRLNRPTLQPEIDQLKRQLNASETSQ